MKRIVLAVFLVLGIAIAGGSPALGSYRSTDEGSVSDATPNAGESVQIEFRGFGPGPRSR
jgi:hypothetical protein